MRYAVSLLVVLFLASQPRSTVPASLVDPATRSPLEFAAALARTEIPAGLEIRESDDRYPATWPPAFDPAAPNGIPLSQLLGVFNGQRRDYRAIASDTGVLVVRPVEEPFAFLDEASHIRAPMTVTGIMTAARHIFSPLDERLLGPRAGSSSLRGEDIPIVLDGRGRTVLDTLNQIAVQAKGHVWVVTTRREGDRQRVIEFGFLMGDGSRRKQPWQLGRAGLPSSD